ncbi:MAG: class I SAM-dependent methyltransferase [Chitinophagaceae bacterium]|nr:class I SAM-dependent methyltransferase [Chitinophagaceae bacterium]
MIDSSAQIDIPGQKTLETISSATLFNEWMFNTIKPYCKGHVLEVGCGIGNISRLLIRNNFKTSLSDYSDQYFDILRKDFGNNGKVEAIYKVDLAVENFESTYPELLSKFDTIIAMNVVEHISDDHLAIRNCRKMLASGGHLIILVPAYQSLFNSFDEELVHFRRYTKKTLTKLFEDENLEIIHKQYFNAAGIAGWYINGSLLKKKLIPEDQMKIFDKLVPAFKLADKLIINRIGLSVIHVGRKND